MQAWQVGLVALVVRASSAHAAPMEPDDLPAPQLEVARDRIAPPAIASFALPPPDGAFHRPRELRVRGRALFGTELAVRGYVTAIYDCAATLAPKYPRLGRVELLAEVDRDPRQCERPHFYLGETRDTPPELSILVVDVPRKPAKPERDGLSRAELAAWPRVPVLAVGDALQVSGQWTTEAPHGQRSTRGLLVYRASQRDPSPRASVRAPSVMTPVVLGSTVRAKPPQRKAIAIATYNASVDALNACTRAVRAARYDAAAPPCEAALATWPDNHLAWYATTSIHLARRDWPRAQAAIERAIALRPDVAMYQQYLGMALYERAHAEAEEPATASASTPTEPVASPTPASAKPSATLEAARDALQRAVAIEPGLWRAHLYLGRAYSELDDARGAAEQFALAIATNRTSPTAYVSLSELYRQWDSLVEARAIAQLGIRNVPAADSASVWSEMGMIFDAQRADADAIAAFTKVLSAQRRTPADEARAHFQRGQAYARTQDAAHARADLDAAMRSAYATPLMRTLASQWLSRLGGDQRAGANVCSRRDQCIKDTDGIGGH